MAAAAHDLDWMNTVREKLGDVFRGKEEDLCRILHFLDEEDSAYKDNPIRPYCPQWRSLKSTLNNDRAFKIFAGRLAEDTKKAEKDGAFRRRMNQVYEEMMDYSDESQSADRSQGPNASRLADRQVNTMSSFTGLARALAVLPVESQTAVEGVIARVGSRQVASMTDDVVGVFRVFSKTTGTIVMVGLAAVYLSMKAIWSMYRWWKGEISGKRCAKNVIDEIVAVGAGIAGGFAGAALGSLAGPVGTVIGGIAGGVVAGAAANFLSDILTQKIFGIPKDEALENAYNYLGVEMTASNSDINTAFRQKCLQLHPDRPGGDKEEFFVLQCHMATIKMSRGEL